MFFKQKYENVLLFTGQEDNSSYTIPPREWKDEEKTQITIIKETREKKKKKKKKGKATNEVVSYSFDTPDFFLRYIHSSFGYTCGCWNIIISSPFCRIISDYMPATIWEDV